MLVGSRGVDDHQPGGIPGRDGVLGNFLWWQVVFVSGEGIISWMAIAHRLDRLGGYTQAI